MRGADVMEEELFTLGGLDQYVPADHPLRRVRDVFNGCLFRMDTHFGELYSPFGRESIAPEKLLRALMLLSEQGDQCIRSTPRSSQNGNTSARTGRRASLLGRSGKPNLKGVA